MAVNLMGRRTRRAFGALLPAALALCLSACAAASRTPEAGRPRATDAPYPVVLGASEERREQALTTWAALTRAAGLSGAPAPELHPVTATLGTLPAALNAPLRLPLVGGGEGKEPTEEDMREALRRFIRTAAPLLGVVPAELSLVEHTNNPDGTKRARYRQSPFDLPLRGGFGNLEITYAPDRRIVAISSTAIPDTERLRRALATARQQQTVASDRVASALSGRVLQFTDSAGSAQTYTVAASDQVTVREMVIYPVRPATDPSTLELHLAWEVAIERPGGPLVVYLDAVRGEQIAATTLAPPKN